MNFEPWVGDRYGHHNYLGLPVRLLVLGESHYGAEDRPDITKEVVAEVFAKDVPYRYRFFTSVFMAACGEEKEPTREALKEFCHAIAFYNFIQDMLGTPGDRPSAEQWKGGLAHFFECLVTLKPSHVIACGFGLWDNLPSEGFSDLDERSVLEQLPQRYRDNASHKHRGWVGRYDHAGGKCLILKIRHPSMAFSADEWHPLLQKFFKLEVD